MGCSTSYEDIQREMEDAELNILRFADVPLESIKRTYVTFEMDGKPFRCRSLTIENESENKPTLVMPHGALRAVINCYKMIKPLS